MGRAHSAAPGPPTFNIKVDAGSSRRAESLPEPGSAHLLRKHSLPAGLLDDLKCGSPTMAGEDPPTVSSHILPITA